MPELKDLQVEALVHDLVASLTAVRADTYNDAGTRGDFGDDKASGPGGEVTVAGKLAAFRLEDTTFTGPQLIAAVLCAFTAGVACERSQR